MGRLGIAVAVVFLTLVVTVELVLRLAVLALLACTVLGLMIVVDEDQLEVVVRPVLLPALQDAVKAL